jgi:hypothetical protein
MSIEPTILIRVIVPETPEIVLDLTTRVSTLPQAAIEVLGPYYVALTNASLTSESEIELSAPVSGEYTFPLPVVPFSIRHLFINGLRQRPSGVTFVGQAVTLPASLQIVAGDILTLIYSH